MEQSECWRRRNHLGRITSSTHVIPEAVQRLAERPDWLGAALNSEVVAQMIGAHLRVVVRSPAVENTSRSPSGLKEGSDDT
jgi:hypothetical protein